MAALGGALVVIAAIGVALVLVGATAIGLRKNDHERRHEADNRWPRISL